MFFHIDDQTTFSRIVKMLQKRKKEETLQGDYGVMQHFLFC
jgi:hypothetical protein